MSDLAGLLREQGWEPESNVCASCGHPGGEHDLGNWCLTCPRPDVTPTGRPFTARIEAGWDYFASFTKEALWERAVGLLSAAGVQVTGEPRLREALPGLDALLVLDAATAGRIIAERPDVWAIIRAALAGETTA